MADVITSAQLDDTKQALIASVVQKELAFKAKIRPMVTDLSRFAVKGAKSIEIPKLTSFTVVNRTGGTPGDATALTASNDLLSFDQNAYVAWHADPTDVIQSTLDYQLWAAQRAASAHGRNVDTVIVAEMETAGRAVAAIGDITRDSILDMQEDLLSKEADEDKLRLIVGPDQKKAMLKIAEFTEHRIYGSSNIPAGQIGTVYGVPVSVSNALAAGQFFMFDMDAMAIAFQLGPNMSDQMANEYGSQSRRWVLDQKFGVAALLLGEQGVLATESALIVKDSNL